jgi:hypothetical protein
METGKGNFSSIPRTDVDDQSDGTAAALAKTARFNCDLARPEL